jgi:sugar (pentulose or hexulose) kinase
VTDHILAIDHGTQSVRALLFDARGTLAAKSRVAVSYLSPEPGWAEQDPEVLWGAVAEACRRLWAGSPVPKDAVRGVTLTTQRGTVVNVDDAGRPLRPAITWMDRRRTEGLRPIGGLWGAAFWLSGMGDTVAYFQAEAEANWIARHEPELWARTRRYLLLSGFLTHRLTGRFVDSVGAQVGYLPFDFKRLRWAGASDWKWRIAPFDRAKLPELVPPGAPLGEITAAAAAATGIPAGLPVIAGAADKACEVLGSGALAPHVGCLSYSTIATVNTTQRRYVEPIPLIPPYPAAVPGAYSLEMQVARGYWMVTWFKEEFGHPERVRAEALGVEPESLFDELVREAAPGSSGLMLQPYWSPGVKVPGPEARGAVIGFRVGHRRPHLYRAILEGLAYALREAAERIARRSGTPITELRVAGGGSQSDGAMQLTADVFGLPASRPHVYEASGLGAAIDAAVGLGLHPDFETAVREMTRPGTTFEPNASAAATYERLYREVYLEMYARVRPLYRKIRDIVGY